MSEKSKLMEAEMAKTIKGLEHGLKRLQEMSKPKEILTAREFAKTAGHEIFDESVMEVMMREYAEYYHEQMS